MFTPFEVYQSRILNPSPNVLIVSESPLKKRLTVKFKSNLSGYGPCGVYSSVDPVQPTIPQSIHSVHKIYYYYHRVRRRRQDL
jgi:hypothetical protein